MQIQNLQIAELLMRLLAGMLFLFQGYDKLFRIKMTAVVDVFTADAEKHHIPRPMLHSVAWLTSLLEFAGGFCLIFGFMTDYALYLLGVDLLVVGFAFTYMSPIWDMKYVFPRFTLIIALLLINVPERIFALENLF